MNMNPHLHSNTERKLALTGWGLFLAWLGTAALTGVPVWISLLGIGAITLGIQGTRRTVGLKLEGFWVAVGVCFVIGSVWAFTGTTVPLLPVLLIVVGAGVVVAVLTGRED